MSAVRKPGEVPDLAKIRDDFETLKQRVRDAGDLERLQELEDLERRVSEPSFREHAPTVAEQLSDHLKRLGIT
jgi:hypothetical protein